MMKLISTLILIVLVGCDSKKTEPVAVISDNTQKNKVAKEAATPINEFVIDDVLFVKYDKINEESSKVFYEDLRMYNNKTDELIERFQQPGIWQVEGIREKDSFSIKLSGSNYSLNIKYFIKADKVKWDSECKLVPTKSEFTLADLLKKYDEGVDGELVTGLISKLVFSKDKKARDYLIKPTKDQKKYHRFNDGAASYQSTIRLVNLLEKYGCKWD